MIRSFEGRFQATAPNSAAEEQYGFGAPIVTYCGAPLSRDVKYSQS